MGRHNWPWGNLILATAQGSGATRPNLTKVVSPELGVDQIRQEWIDFDCRRPDTKGLSC